MIWTHSPHHLHDESGQMSDFSIFVMWRNLNFLHTTDVEKFQISPHGHVVPVTNIRYVCHLHFKLFQSPILHLADGFRLPPRERWRTEHRLILCHNNQKHLSKQKQDIMLLNARRRISPNLESTVGINLALFYFLSSCFFLLMYSYLNSLAMKLGHFGNLFHSLQHETALACW